MESDRNDNVVHSLHGILELLHKMVQEQGLDSSTRQQMPPKVIYNRSRTITNVSVVNNLDIGKSKRTRRKPRNKKSKDTVDNVSNTQLNASSSFPRKAVIHDSIPSTSKGITNDPSSSKILTSIKGNKTIPCNHHAEIKYSFTIKPIKINRTGQLIRRRNLKYKYVNLKSFVQSTNQLPYIFTTKLKSINRLSSNFTKLSVANKAIMTKSQLRKYPAQNLSSNEPCGSTEGSIQSETKAKGKKKDKKKNKQEKAKEKVHFPNYIDIDEVNSGLANGTLIKGFLRINPKNFKDSYVNNEDTSLADYYLTSVMDRNRALEGDEVVLMVKPEEEWINGKKTAKVVFIKQMIHPRISVGTLTCEKQNNRYAILFPRDKRNPVIRIPPTSWPEDFKRNPKLYTNHLFVAKITEWTSPTHAIGVITECLGPSGDLKVETQSILREFLLDTTPFGSEMSRYFPKSDIPQKEFTYREDIRTECVFTIDPITARDLDDAVSVKELPNGNYEIGVHISDVTHYLSEGTELDQMVSKKATTIYLVNETYHMLPVELCLHCSLLPGQDKLSFSVFWEMNEDGEIIARRFTRSVMNSCSQLAYEHAQLIIENPDKELDDGEIPTIHNGFSTKDIRKAVNILQKIAVKLRERRVQNGALKIDQVKLMFILDRQTGEPLDFCKYENKESHRLIEEFMLLANISVAERLSEIYPELAFLRCHEPPKQTMLVELQSILASCGIHIDISSAGGIHASLCKYVTDDFPGQCRAAVLNHITAKAMTRARYFCASTMESELDYKHYALSVPIYTHFTSPIRRYADIMVHRLLAASLDYSEKPEWDVDYVSAIAANCNAQKYNAKRAGEASSDLYLAHYVEKNQPFEQQCVVVDVKERSFDAIVLKTGSVIRIYQNNCEEGTTWQTENVATTNSSNGKTILKLTVTFPKTALFPKTPLIVEMFTTIKVILERKNSYKLEAKLLRPVCPLVYTR